MPNKHTDAPQEIAAEVLAVAVEKAIKIERERSDRETVVAVQTAKRQAEVDARFGQHESRLNSINGSIRKTGESLDSLKDHIVKRDEKQDKLNTEAATREALHWREQGTAFSKKAVYAGYATVLAMVAIPFATEIAKLI